MNDLKTADPELEVIFPAEAIARRLGELARDDRQREASKT